MTTGTALLGSSLAVAATVTAWPQTVRLARTRVTAGVDPRTVVLALITMQAWTGYTLRLGDWPAFASSVGPLLAWSATLGLLVRYRQDQARRYAWYAAVAALVVTAWTCTPAWAALGYLAGLGSAAWALPQLKTALSHQPLHGVSIPAYLLIAAEDAGWLAYAILTKTPAYALGALVQGPACAWIAVRAAAHR